MGGCRWPVLRKLLLALSKLDKPPYTALRIALGLGMGSNESEDKTQVLVNQPDGRRGRAEGLELWSYLTHSKSTNGYSDLELRKGEEFEQGFQNHQH